MFYVFACFSVTLSYCFYTLTFYTIYKNRIALNGSIYCIISNKKLVSCFSSKSWELELVPAEFPQDKRVANLLAMVPAGTDTAQDQ